MHKRELLQVFEDLLEDVETVDSAAVAKIDAMLWVLYPGGVQPGQYADLVRAIRALDQLCAAVTAALPGGDRPPRRLPARSEASQSDAGVVQPVEDDATAPIPTATAVAVAASTSPRPWTPLGDFSLRCAGREAQRLVSHYSAVAENLPERGA